MEIHIEAVCIRILNHDEKCLNQEFLRVGQGDRNALCHTYVICHMVNLEFIYGEFMNLEFMVVYVICHMSLVNLEYLLC